MVATATVTYKAEGSPDTILSFNLTGVDADDIHRKLASKKRELDERFSIDSHKTVLIWTVSHKI
jgi:hypothetical protein